MCIRDRSPSYLDLLKDKRVQESMITALSSELEPGEAATARDGRCKEMGVSSWHPTYVFAPGNLSTSEAFQVSIDVPLPPEGWGYAVWVEGYDGNHWLPMPVSYTHLDVYKRQVQTTLS